MDTHIQAEAQKLIDLMDGFWTNTTAKNMPFDHPDNKDILYRASGLAAVIKMAQAWQAKRLFEEALERRGVGVSQ